MSSWILGLIIKYMYRKKNFKTVTEPSREVELLGSVFPLQDVQPADIKGVALLQPSLLIPQFSYSAKTVSKLAQISSLSSAILQIEFLFCLKCPFFL